MKLARSLSLAFAAGALGAVALIAFLWLVRESDVLTALRIRNVPAPRLPDFLYSRIVWGGLWALLLVVPVLTTKWLLRGALLGVLASLAAIFYFNPAWKSAPFTFVLLVFAANIVWGIVASGWYRAVNR